MSNIETLDNIYKDQIKPAIEKFKIALMRANRKCPECEGTNLNSTHTKCWDCSSSDYRQITQQPILNPQFHDQGFFLAFIISTTTRHYPGALLDLFLTPCRTQGNLSGADFRKYDYSLYIRNRIVPSIPSIRLQTAILSKYWQNMAYCSNIGLIRAQRCLTVFPILQYYTCSRYTLVTTQANELGGSK